MEIPFHPPPPGYAYSHSVPHSPYVYDYDHYPPPPSHRDIESAFRHVHSSLPRGYYDVPGYPPGARPRSPRARSHSPFPPGFSLNYEPESHGGPERQYTSPQSTEENVRSTNLAVQLVNGQISPSAKCAQLQPKMVREGWFPADFRIPRTVGDVQALESSTIERILLAYSLPTDLRSFRMSGVENPSSKVIKQAKICTLFDFLGATRLADHERMKAEKWRQQRAILAY